MNNENKHIIEINGIKMEVDLRTAKRVDTFRVGDPVKILITGSSDAEVKPGVIVDFEEFEKLPTIVVAYMVDSYYDGGLKFAHINAKTKDKYELVASSSDTMLALNKSALVDKMDREIEKKMVELAEMRQKKQYFLERFGVYFGAAETA